ncbi:MAG: GNAT family N-acetyltransferase [Candidatus Thorarchaeota archaeon]
MVQIIEFNRDVHGSDLYRLNIEYVTWVADRFRTELNLDFGKVLGASIEEYVSGFLEEFMKIKPPHGIILLIEDQGKIVGMGAVHERVPGVGEITRMFIHTSYRGSGLGTEMLDRLVSKGKEFSYKKLRLDTSEHFPYAIQLYQSAGFIEVALDNLGEAQPETQHIQMELVLRDL